jgi:hypothetical protein
VTQKICDLRSRFQIFFRRTVPPKEAIEIIASPVPQIAVKRRKANGWTVIGRSTMTGATIGPSLCGGLPLTMGGLGVVAGVGVPGFAAGADFDSGPGFGAGAGAPDFGIGLVGGGGPSMYFNAKSETM